MTTLAVLPQDPDEDARITNLADLSAFAASRTLPGPIHLTTPDGRKRSFLTERLEELADARNYACWEYRDAMLRDDERAAEKALRDLAGIVRLWTEMTGADPLDQLPAQHEHG